MTSTAAVASPVDFDTYGEYSVQAPRQADGSFVRPLYRFQGRISADGSSGYPAEAGRYHLYVSLACPWAHRSVIARKLLGLEDVISLSVVDPVRDGRGWAFREGPGCTPDPVNGFTLLRQAYEATEPGYDGHVYRLTADRGRHERGAMADGVAGRPPGRSGTPGGTGQAGGAAGGDGGALRGWWLPPRMVREAGHDPDARFSMANERTFLAWVRTSLALLAGGVAVIQLVPNFSVPGGRHILGVALIVLSIVVAVSSYRHWALSEQAMRLGRPLPPSPLPRILGAGVSLVALAALVIVLVSIA